MGEVQVGAVFHRSRACTSDVTPIRDQQSQSQDPGRCGVHDLSTTITKEDHKEANTDSITCSYAPREDVYVKRVSSPHNPPIPFQRRNRCKPRHPNAQLESAYAVHQARPVGVRHAHHRVNRALQAANVAPALMLVVACVMVKMVLPVQPLVLLRHATQPDFVVGSVGYLLRCMLVELLAGPEEQDSPCAPATSSSPPRPHPPTPNKTARTRRPRYSHDCQQAIL